MARIFDGIFFALIALIGGVIFDLIIFRSSTFHWINFTYLAILIYNIVMLGVYGQTIGKRILQIKLVDNMGKKVKLGRVVIREFVIYFILYGSQMSKVIGEYFYTYWVNENIVFMITLILLLIDLSTIWIGGKKLPLHDILINTKVIDV